MRRYVISVIVLATLAYVLAMALGGVRADDRAAQKKITPPKPERVMRVATTFCRSLAQIKEIARLTLAGNSPEEALMQINMSWRIELCERGSWPVSRPELQKLYETGSHTVAIYKVQTTAGERFIFFAIRRFKI